jgi:multiple sugar transport system permease protein
MATVEAVARPQYVHGPRRGPITRLLEDQRWLATCLMLPTVVLLALFIAYPFFKGIELAVTDTTVGVPGKFVGLDNFTKIWSDDIFHVAVWNTCLYTFVTTVFKLVLGLWLALLLNQVKGGGRIQTFVVSICDYVWALMSRNWILWIWGWLTQVLPLVWVLRRMFNSKAVLRAVILLPFIIPTVLSTFAWKWMFDPTFSVLNWSWLHLGWLTADIWSLISSFFSNFPHLSAVGIGPDVKPFFGTTRTNWLGDPVLAMISVIIVNVWRGVPFYAISLLAGLQTISPELHEAAAIDGARPWQRFRHVTWPLLLPVTLVIVLFSVIQTFADFQLVYVLTGGGPANATQLFATYAYQLGIGTGLLSQGAAISLAIFPILLLVVIVQLVYIRRAETL